MEAIISTFHIDWKIIIAQAINFAIVFTVLYIYALKPLSKLMAERQAKIEKGVEDAKKSEELLKQAQQEYQQNLIQLRKDSIEEKKILEKELEKLKAKNLERIKEDNDQWMKNRVKEMEIDKRKLVESVKGEIVTIAVLMAQKIISKAGYKFDEKDIKELENTLR